MTAPARPKRAALPLGLFVPLTVLGGATLVVAWFLRIAMRDLAGGTEAVGALLALSSVLVVFASVVAYALGRTIEEDVAAVTRRIEAAAGFTGEPVGEQAPIRSLDEIGRLTVAFNQLVRRFRELENSYRDNLQKARHADRDRAGFLAAVSHELRTPLNAILGFADVLADEVDGPLPEGALEDVEQIRASGRHLSDLIHDLLEFSALESGQLRLKRKPVDLFAIASELVREARASKGELPIEIVVSGSALMVNADPKRVRQVLGNLLSNAIKFTSEGTIRVSVEARERFASVSVSDTGPGIGEEEKLLIFEDYTQAADEKPRRRGTGLGLAIARRLATIHGGKIDLASRVGEGSTFTLYLPLEG